MHFICILPPVAENNQKIIALTQFASKIKPQIDDFLWRFTPGKPTDRKKKRGEVDSYHMQFTSGRPAGNRGQVYTISRKQELYWPSWLVTLTGACPIKVSGETRGKMGVALI